MNSASIFDLSPSAKLQLVEDLWDDLAASSEAVPVHDWQKQELARRKANLLKNPALGLSWEEVKRRVRAQNRQNCQALARRSPTRRLAPLRGLQQPVQCG